MKTVSVERLRELLSYDPETGDLIWIHQGPRRLQGKVAGGVNKKGYRVVIIDGTSVRAHRAAWAMVHGSYPEADIDHINRDRLDNRIANLRLASPLQNSHNRKVRDDASSGLKGVTWYKKDKKWCARIVVAGKRIFLGGFDRKEDASAAYLAGAKKYHGEFAAA